VNTKLKDTFDRAGRTFVQAATGVMSIQAMSIALDVGRGTYVPDVDWLKRVGISAVAAGVIALVSFFHNWAEDHGVVPTMMKPTDRSVGDVALGETKPGAVQ
jgi:hypothetical protein